MPWSNGYYPPAYRNQPVRLRQKAVQIANNLLMNGVDEETAVNEGLRKATEFFLTKMSPIDTKLPAFP
jgi:uncharacterized protein YdaT